MQAIRTARDRIATELALDPTLLASRAVMEDMAQRMESGTDPWASPDLRAWQCELLRGAITNMRRAYPQFLTAEGTALPRDVQTVIFPLAYWDLIRQQAALHDLDPFLVAALVAQDPFEIEVYGYRTEPRAEWDLDAHLNYVATGYVYKVGVEILMLPITYRVIHWLKKHEHSYVPWE